MICGGSIARKPKRRMISEGVLFPPLAWSSTRNSPTGIDKTVREGITGQREHMVDQALLEIFNRDDGKRAFEQLKPRLRNAEQANHTTRQAT